MSIANQTVYVNGYPRVGTKTAKVPAISNSGTSGTPTTTEIIIHAMIEPNVMKTPMVAAPSSKPS
jgi:hypothetical protein